MAVDLLLLLFLLLLGFLNWALEAVMKKSSIPLLAVIDLSGDCECSGTNQGKQT